jgi:anti-sigma factor RsiW
MNCAWVKERLLLYLAGELEPGQTARLVRHLERCTPCHTMMESLAETAGRMEAALPTPIEPPATLDARVMEIVRGLPAPRRSWPGLLPRQRVLHRLALGAAALCLMTASFFAGRWDAVHQGLATIVVAPTIAPTLDLTVLGAAHQQVLQTPPVEVRTANPQVLSQALSSLLPFPVAAVNLQDEGMRLVGGNRATIQGVPVAALHYQWNGQRISLFQMDSRKLSPQALQQVVLRSSNSDTYFVRKTADLTYVTWSFGETNCVMVARTVPMHLLFRLACHVSEKLERA